MSESAKAGPWNLSAEELRKLTKWPDQVIEDYLNLTRQMAIVENTVIINVNNVQELFGEVAQSFTLATGLRKSVAQLQQVVSAHDAALAQHASTERDLLRQLGQLQQQLSAVVPTLAKLASVKRDLTRLINSNMQQLTALQNGLGAANARITELQDQLNNTQQQMAALT